MTPDEIRDASEQIKSLINWAKNEYTSIYVEIEDEEYSVNLGHFGEQEMCVTVSRDDYSVDPHELIDNNSPTTLRNLQDIADDLAAHAEVQEESLTLEQHVGKMLLSDDEQEAALATALAAVIRLDAASRQLRAVSTPAPLPWPGALRGDIDYTAEDFPQRYQPPPGFVWRKAGTHHETADGLTDVARIPVGEIKMTGDMVIDDLGRVRWIDRADGNYANGHRWGVWHRERDGIPKATSCDGATPPRALDPHGYVIEEPHTAGTRYGDPEYNWESGVVGETAREVITGLSNVLPEFAPPSPVSV